MNNSPCDNEGHDYSVPVKKVYFRNCVSDVVEYTTITNVLCTKCSDVKKVNLSTE